MLEYQKIWKYHGWANDRVFEHLARLPEEVFTQEVRSVFPSIEKTLQHIYTVDQLWFSRMTGQTKTDISISTTNMSELQTLFRELHAEMESDIFPDRLHEPVTYSNSKGETFTNPVSEILQHVVNHGTYHRGNISAMLRQLGYPGASTDYIFFLRSVASPWREDWPDDKR